MSKICIISPSLKLGGIERALTTLTKEFQLIGHDIHFVICLKDVHFYHLNEKIKVYEPYFKRTSSNLNKLLFYPRLLLYIRSTVLSIKPDRVLVFGDLFSPITLLALIGTNYQIYVSDRTIPNYKFGFPILFLKKLLYPKCAGFIAQTKRSRDFKIRQFSDKLRIEIIPNALPELNKCNLNNSMRETKLIYVGRFAWEKDPEILIHAMKNVSIRFPNWTLEMAGTGPLLEPMKALANELSIENNVEFLGKVSDVAALYQSASILVLPSIVEGFPNTLIEAMFFGLPTICFSDIPFEDIITNNVDGLVVQERSPEALTDIITLLIENESLRSELGTNASISVSRFDKQNISKQVLSFMKL